MVMSYWLLPSQKLANPHQHTQEVITQVESHPNLRRSQIVLTVSDEAALRCIVRTVKEQAVLSASR